MPEALIAKDPAPVRVTEDQCGAGVRCEGNERVNVLLHNELAQERRVPAHRIRTGERPGGGRYVLCQGFLSRPHAAIMKDAMFSVERWLPPLRFRSTAPSFKSTRSKPSQSLPNQPQRDDLVPRIPRWYCWRLRTLGLRGSSRSPTTDLMRFLRSLLAIQNASSVK